MRKSNAAVVNQQTLSAINRTREKNKAILLSIRMTFCAVPRTFNPTLLHLLLQTTSKQFGLSPATD